VQFADLVPVEKVNQAMLIAGDKYRHRNPFTPEDHTPREPRRVCQRGERPMEPVLVEVETCQGPLDPHEKESQLRVLVLVGVKYVSTVGEEKIRGHRDQSLAINGMEQQNGALAHDFQESCSWSTASAISKK
jgi:hypothetical protein